MTDERILQKMQMQQPDALDALMKKYSRYVYNVIAYILGRAGGHEDVEELLQDTFYSVWQHAENIQSRKLKAYLCAAARHVDHDVGQPDAGRERFRRVRLFHLSGRVPAQRGSGHRDGDIVAVDKLLSLPVRGGVHRPAVGGPELREESRSYEN